MSSRSRCLLVATLVCLVGCWPSLGRARPSVEPTSDVRRDAFTGWFHEAGNLLLHVSNRGFFGNRGLDQTFPSAEWPAGTNQEYLFGAGLWVGGIVNRSGSEDTLVSASLYQQTTEGINFEFFNFEQEEGCGFPPVGICETFEGASSGQRLFDDDGDGSIDEDPLNGKDDDEDGRVDEDFAGISQQMFRTTYYDTSRFFNQFFATESNHHTPLGLEVVQESYVWTDPQFDDFVGIEFQVKNISATLNGVGWDIERAYIGFMVDGDVGLDAPDVDNFRDDQSAFAELDTTLTPEGATEPITLSLTMGYTYDTLAEELGEAADDVPGYVGVMFLGHTVDTTAVDFTDALAPREVGIHAYRVWASENDQDPRDDIDRYRFLRGRFDTTRTIDANTDRFADYRFLVSAGPFARIPPESTLTFQVAFVCGDMVLEVDPETGRERRVPDFTNPIQAQRVYDGFTDPDGNIIHWATSSPPPPPNIRLSPGDENVVVEWDDFPERTRDPFTRELDFAGYQVWKAEGWRRESNIPTEEMWRLIADFDSTELGDIDTGLSGAGKYRFVDQRVQNGFWYWYAVSAYDRGTFQVNVDNTTFPPDTTIVQIDAPKFGKFSQNMERVMPRTTPAQTLADVYVVPNPYRSSAAWDLAETTFEPTGRRVKFFNLPERATVRIFTLAGDHVITLDHDANRPGSDGGQLAWNLVSKNNQDTVSGIYLYHVEAEGAQTVGKLVVIR